MRVEQWAAEVMQGRTPRERAARVVPLLEAVRPRWEAVWSALDDEAAPEDIQLGREGVAALKRFVDGVLDQDDRSALLEASEALANEVGENGQQLDGDEGAGFAHLFTALLTACLHDAAGEPERFEEVLGAVAGLVESFPSTRSAFEGLPPSE